MDHDQRWSVFGKMEEAIPPSPVNGKTLLAEIEQFQRNSLADAYYAPFNINSKNFLHI